MPTAKNSAKKTSNSVIRRNAGAFSEKVQKAGNFKGYLFLLRQAYLLTKVKENDIKSCDKFEI